MTKKIPLTIAALFLASCSSAPKKPQTGDSADQGTSHAKSSHSSRKTRSTAAAGAAEEREFKEIHDLYAKANYEGALKRLDVFLSLHVNSPMIAQAENLTGLCYLLTKRPAQAVPHFKMAIQSNPGAQAFNQYVLYNEAKAELEAGMSEEAQQSLSKIDPQVYDTENRIKYHFLKAQLLLKRNLPYESAREVLLASRLTEGLQIREMRPGFASALDASLQQVGGTSPLEDLYKEFEDSPVADLLLFRLASRAQSQGDLPKSEIYLQTLMARFPQSDFFAQAQALNRAKESAGPVEPSSIGILLPLKGKFAKFGTRSLQGVELAFRIFDQAWPDSKITLVLEDSGEEAESAVKALNRLVSKHHVIAVIGPLLTKGIDTVTRRAQELGVPMLTLARQTGSSGEYVIPAGLTLQLQAYEIARYAIQKQNLHRFAIVSPRDRVGDDFAQYFWDAAESLGGEITGIESYNPGETDFRQQVDKLSGLYYTEARQKELDELAKLREENKIKKRTRKTEQYYNLKPIVDYDAVFVPDEPKVAGQVLPTFAYRDVDHVRFLGPSAWNSPEFPSRAQRSAEDAFFAAAYFPESASPEVKKFIERYRTVFNQDPSELDAIAFDAAEILGQALTESGKGATRSEVLSNLKKIRNYSGVTGTISYKDGQYFRDLKVLTVQGGQIVDAAAAKTSSSR